MKYIILIILLISALCDRRLPCHDNKGALIEGCIILHEHDQNTNKSEHIYSQEPGVYRLFEFAYNKIPTSQNITIMASPCYGSIKLTVYPPIANVSDLDMDQYWSESAGYADNIITVPSRFIALFIKVFSYNDTKYQIGVYYTDPPDVDDIDYMEAVSPEIDDIILKGDPMEMNVTFNTTSDSEATYDVYKVQRSKRAGTKCNIIDGAEDECVMKTECGLQELIKAKVAAKSESIVNPSPNSKKSVMVKDLVQNVNYTFNAVVHLKSGLSIAYRGTQGTPEFEYTATNVSKGTTIAIIVSIVVVVILLIILMIYMKMRLVKRYERIKTNSYENRDMTKV